MSFAKWWFNRFRAFRSFKWYYNPRWLNIELGEQAEPAFRQQLREKISNPDGKTYVPPELEEIRQAYENKAIDTVEDFRKRSGRLFKKIDVCARRALPMHT